jgi:hypothetical protein
MPPGPKGLTIRPKVDNGVKELCPVSDSQEAGYVNYHMVPHIGRLAIHPREYLDLIPK